MKPVLKLCLILALSGSAPAVLAHGKEEHSAKTSATKKTQQEWGIAGSAANATRTVQIAMTDAMRFIPDKLEVKQGETLRFQIRNEGKMLHEFVLGTKRTLDEHAAMMSKFPDMEHDEPYMAHVQPGKTMEIVWTFNRPGTFNYACLIAGHYQAGMVGTVRVAPK